MKYLKRTNEDALNGGVDEKGCNKNTGQLKCKMDTKPDVHIEAVQFTFSSKYS